MSAGAEAMRASLAQLVDWSSERLEAPKTRYVSDRDGDAFTQAAAAQCVALITHASAAIAGRAGPALEQFPKIAEALQANALDAWFDPGAPLTGGVRWV
jgi:hypothetical protein